MNPLFHCRLTAPGWANFTGSMGHNAMFVDGRSVEPLNARQIARIGSTTVLVNDETGEQVGPSVIHLFIQSAQMDTPAPLAVQTQVEQDAEAEKARLVAEEAARKQAEAAALAEAEAKRQSQVEQQVVYSRQELEAIGANDGITGLRAIAEPLRVRGRAIAELVNEILEAQAKAAVA